jgi:hypothetical protein
VLVQLRIWTVFWSDLAGESLRATIRIAQYVHQTEKNSINHSVQNIT